MQQALDALRGLPFPPQSLQTHWLGLKDLPLTALQSAVEAAAQRCDRFPSPAELRQLADLSPAALPEVPSRVTPLAEPQVVGHLPTGRAIVQTAVYAPCCATCNDSGWAPTTMWHAKDGTPVPGGAPAVTRCGCWADNPVLVRQRAQQARYAQQRVKGRGGE
jgi:hypothetical protein